MKIIMNLSSFLFVTFLICCEADSSHTNQNHSTISDDSGTRNDNFKTKKNKAVRLYQHVYGNCLTKAEIDSTGPYYYDETKWRLYCEYCDDTCVFLKSTAYKDTVVTFGSLDLRFDGCLRIEDTLHLYFFFYIDTLICNSRSVNNYISTGLAYRLYQRTPFGYTGEDVVDYFWDYRPTSRMIKPLQPEVIRYIKRNRNKLNPWFREEAIRRGVLTQ